MSWREKIARLIAPNSVKNLGPIGGESADSGTYWQGLPYGAAANLPVPSETNVMTVTAIWACVNLISGAISAIPKDIFARTVETGESSQLFGDPLWWVMNEELSPRWMAATGWEYLMQSLLLHGDAFAVIHRGSKSQPIGLEPVHPLRVTVSLLPDWPGGRLMYRIEPEPLMYGTSNDKSKVLLLDQDDVIHIPGAGFNGFRGMSPLKNSLKMAGAVALATQEYAGNYFANGARPDFTLSTDQQLTQEKIAGMRSQIAENHAGYKNSYKPMILESGLTYQQIEISNEDAQLLSTRQFQIEEIARAYGIPPWLLGHNEKTTSWGTGIEAIGQAFVRYTLGRHLVKIENECNRKLFRTAAKHMAFDTFIFERSDMKSLFEAFRNAIGGSMGPGWMTDEEIRQKLKMKLKPSTPLYAGPTASSPTPAKEGATA